MPSVERDPRLRRVVIGVDTHKHIHVAVALDDIGGRLDTRSFPADQDGYRQLLDWAAGFGAKRLVFGIEGTGSYGADRAGVLAAAGGACLWGVKSQLRGLTCG
ncbi:transposase [Saccharothrix ecbatanensis]|uniref:Transposase n=1 Tax=Saccharothrix ecbatanensis TaxID=1105145 RepID=A0A7W9HDG0_9PSEU|nr:transposase [Saccharothrix ecbatanensis]MBB5800237.1 transposase [Saccharothrix ecbatanensis]